MIPCRLSARVSGDPAPLHALVSSLEGSGFVDWPDIDPHRIVEPMAGLLLRRGAHGGAESYDQARRIGDKLAFGIALRIESGRRAAEMGHVFPLDLQAIRPIPRPVLMKGFNSGGLEWLRDNWGVEAPLAHVDLRLKTEIVETPRGRGRPRSGAKREIWTQTQANWTFSATHFPFPCLRLLLKKWPQIEFQACFDDEFGLFDKVWPALDEDIISRVEAAA
jgi:hypothetical protein